MQQRKRKERRRVSIATHVRSLVVARPSIDSHACSSLQSDSSLEVGETRVDGDMLRSCRAQPRRRARNPVRPMHAAMNREQEHTKSGVQGPGATQLVLRSRRGGRDWTGPRHARKCGGGSRLDHLFCVAGERDRASTLRCVRSPELVSSPHFSSPSFRAACLSSLDNFQEIFRGCIHRLIRIAATREGPRDAPRTALLTSTC